MKKLMLAMLLVMFMATATFAVTQEIQFAWTANPPADQVAGYNIYKAETPDGPWEKLNSELIPGITYSTEITEAVEATMYFYCTAVDNTALESAPSNIVSGNIDTVPPGSPSGMTITISIKIGN